MPVDYYLGKSVAELEVLLTAAQERKAKGNLTEVSAAGIRSVREFSSNVRVEREIFELRYSLFLRSAESDSPWPDPRLERVRRTRPQYR